MGSKLDVAISKKLDQMTNEIEQGFRQRKGWELCRYLLGKMTKEHIEEVDRLRKKMADMKEHWETRTDVMRDASMDGVRFRVIMNDLFAESEGESGQIGEIYKA